MGSNVHILAKPIGSLCNLNCEYCFYTEKKALYPDTQNFRMSGQVLETFISQYIKAQPNPEVQFVWQGGEPTLLGVDFFRRAVELQKKYARGKKIVNSLQTNGTLLNDEWGEFLKRNGFLVGLSLDGPEVIHDRYRVTREGKPTFEKVMQGLQLLKEHQVPFNVLSCVTKEAAYAPTEIYQFFKHNGVEYIQFTPIVERLPDAAAMQLGLRHATPASLKAEPLEPEVAPWTVEPEAYGNFLIAIFDEWVRNDVGMIHVMNFEWALTSWLGLAATICVFAEQCGTSLVMEHDGAVFSCDHYVYPDYQLGNILTTSPQDLVVSEKQCLFRQSKSLSLPQYCKDCAAYFACRGECPKHRFLQAPDGESGLNYLCAGYKKYFRHIHPYWTALEVETSLAQRYGANADAITKAFLKAYPNKKAADALFVDALVRSGTIQTARLKADQKKAPVYNYVFAWESPIMDGGGGVYHCAEIPFVFNNMKLTESAHGGEKVAQRLGDQMSQAWINFARTGNPNYRGLPQWPAYTRDSGAIMIFDTKCEVRSNHDLELMRLLTPANNF